MAGFGEFKLAKIMKKICLTTGAITDELFVRSVVKNPKNGITTERLIFERIKKSLGPAKSYVLHANIFSFPKKNDQLGVAIVSAYYPLGFNNLTKEQKKKAMPAIACGIEHLHNHGIVHCDINGKNILMTQNEEPVICDVEGALLFDTQTGLLDAEFKEKRIEKRPYCIAEFSPPEARKFIGPLFDTLEYNRAKKWDIFAFGLLVNYAYNLGIQTVNESATNVHYLEAIDENDVTNKDYREYKMPLIVEDHDKKIVETVLKCLQGQDITWQEIQQVL